MVDSDTVTFKKLKSQDESEHTDDDLVEDETCSVNLKMRVRVHHNIMCQ